MKKIDWAWVAIVIGVGLFTGSLIAQADYHNRYQEALDESVQLTADLEAHALSIWGLEDALGIKQQALDDVIGYLNDCVEAQDAGEQWIPQRSHTGGTVISEWNYYTDEFGYMHWELILPPWEVEALQ